MTSTVKRMNSKETVEYLKGQLKDYLENELGIEDAQSPFHCLNPEHNDNNPSMSFDSKRNKVHCFSCGVDWDIFDVVQATEELPKGKDGFKDALNILCDVYNIDIDGNYRKPNILKKKTHTPSVRNSNETLEERQEDTEDYTNYFLQCYKRHNETTYLKDRGIKEGTIKNFRIGYAPEYKLYFDKETKRWVTGEFIIIPTGKDSYVARNTDPKASPKDRYRKKGTNKLFNFKKGIIDDPAPIFVTEAEIDAMSIIEVGGKAIGLGSVSQADKFIKTLKRNVEPELCPPIILALDNDKAGREASSMIFEELSNAGYFVVDVISEEKEDKDTTLYQSCKDANEMLQKDRHKLYELVQYHQDRVIEEINEFVGNDLKAFDNKHQVSNLIEEFWNGDKADLTFYPTGFDKLDKALDGGFTRGLGLVCALSSLGKTTFTLQIADQMAKLGTDVIVFSLEQGNFELMAKSISRNTLLLSDYDFKNAKTTNGVLHKQRYANYSKEELDLIKQASLAYKEYANHIYMYEISGKITHEFIKKEIQNFVQRKKSKPVVIIDYIQLLSTIDKFGSDKQNVDNTATCLRQVARDLNIPIIAISSINRASYKSEISLSSAKESGALEYSADFFIGLQFKGAGEKGFDEVEAKKISNDISTPRSVELVILKNRNGRTGEKIEYEMYSAFNFFREVSEDWKPSFTAEDTKNFEIKEFEDEDEYNISDID